MYAIRSYYARPLTVTEGAVRDAEEIDQREDVLDGGRASYNFV